MNALTLHQCMPAATDAITLLAMFNLSGGEVLLLLALVLLVAGAGKHRELGQGLSLGFREFLARFRDVNKAFEEGAHDAGRSIGGIYGKPAAEALTPDNRTAELYDPAALRKKQAFDFHDNGSLFFRLKRWCWRVWQSRPWGRPGK